MCDAGSQADLAQIDFRGELSSTISDQNVTPKRNVIMDWNFRSCDFLTRYGRPSPSLSCLEFSSFYESVVLRHAQSNEIDRYN